AINATPLGLKETDPLPLDAERAGRLAAALDLVYAPGGTRWARTLRAAGVPAQDGREVLVQQGAAAFGRFFPDRAAPVEVMRAARGARAQVRGPAAHRGRSGRRNGVARAAGAAGRLARAGAARRRPVAPARL